jgi:hypothetical protein
LFSRQQQYNLHRNYRQEDDSFKKLLERIRRGTLDKRDHKLLKSLSRELELDEGIKPVHLYASIPESELTARLPRKWDVDQINKKELESCSGPTTVYLAHDTPGQTAGGMRVRREEATKMLNQETRFPETLNFRVGAQVMLIMVRHLPLNVITLIFQNMKVGHDELDKI